MAINVAPPRGAGGPSHSKAFAAGFSNNTDLLAVSGRPQHPPQRVDFKNAGASAENAVFTYQGDSGTTTVSIAPGATYPVESPVISLQTSGADVSAVAQWWHGNSVPFNS